MYPFDFILMQLLNSQKESNEPERCHPRRGLYLLLSVLLVGLGSIISEARAQIFLSPQSPTSERSSTNINIDGVSCSAAGGSVPSITMSVGADPYAINDFDGLVGNANANSPFLGIVSLNIPLKRTNQSFSCNELYDLAVKKSKLASLRELVDEQIISEDQYAMAVQNIYKELLENPSSSSKSIEKAITETQVKRDGAVVLEQTTKLLN